MIISKLKILSSLIVGTNWSIEASLECHRLKNYCSWQILHFISFLFFVILRHLKYLIAVIKRVKASHQQPKHYEFSILIEIQFKFHRNRNFIIIFNNFSLADVSFQNFSMFVLEAQWLKWIEKRFESPGELELLDMLQRVEFQSIFLMPIR